MTTWEYGVTTVPQRIDHVLPRTLRSLERGGFHIHQDRIFVDGSIMPNHMPKAVCRGKPIGQFGNYILALWELYLRNPHADYYAMFEDDIVMCRNARAYLEDTMPGLPGYVNLYTAPENASSQRRVGWYGSDQVGRGALALVFHHHQLLYLLYQSSLVHHPKDAHKGKKAADWAIKRAMGERYAEYVHNPSLVQHVGEMSVVDKNKVFTNSPVFAGEDFDAMELLK